MIINCFTKQQWQNTTTTHFPKPRANASRGVEGIALFHASFVLQTPQTSTAVREDQLWSIFSLSQQVSMDPNSLSLLLLWNAVCIKKQPTVFTLTWIYELPKSSKHKHNIWGNGWFIPVYILYLQRNKLNWMLSICYKIEEPCLLRAKILQNKFQSWNSAVLIISLVVWCSAQVGGESSSVGRLR